MSNLDGAFEYNCTETLPSEPFAIIDPSYELLGGLPRRDTVDTPIHGSLEYEKNLVAGVAKQIFPEKSFRIEVSLDDKYGIVVKLTTDLKSREALNLWLKIINNQTVKERGIVIAVNWLGENDVSKHELSKYLSEIMLASKIGPFASSGFDAVAEVREARRE